MSEKVIIAVADVPNANNRIYPRAVLEKAVADFQARIEREGGVAGFAFSDDERMTPTHVVRRVGMDGDKAVAEVQWLKTDIPMDLVEFRTSGAGAVAADGTVENFELFTIAACRKGTGA